MGYYPQESLYKPYKYHGYTVRGTPNCPLIDGKDPKDLIRLKTTRLQSGLASMGKIWHDSKVEIVFPRVFKNKIGRGITRIHSRDYGTNFQTLLAWISSTWTSILLHPLFQAKDQVRITHC